MVKNTPSNPKKNNKPHYDSRSERRKTPPRVAARLGSQQKRMRIRNKKSSLSGKK